MKTIFDGHAWMMSGHDEIRMDMGGSKPSGSTTVVSNSAPWSGQQPYLQNAFAQAQGLFNAGPIQYYPGQTYAGADPAQTQAIQLQEGRALAGSPLVKSDQSMLTSTLNGNFLNPSTNPYLQSTYDLAAGNLRSGIDGEFSGSGRYGSGAQAGALAQGYANLGSQIFGGNYQQERQNQLNAASAALPVANQDYTDISQLYGAGAQNQQLNQNIINDAIQRFNFGQQAPYNQLANFEQFINGNYGSTSTQTQPFFNNTAANLLGGGLGAAEISNLLFGKNNLNLFGGA